MKFIQLFILLVISNILLVNSALFYLLNSINLDKKINKSSSLFHSLDSKNTDIDNLDNLDNINKHMTITDQEKIIEIIKKINKGHRVINDICDSYELE